MARRGRARVRRGSRSGAVSRRRSEGFGLLAVEAEGGVDGGEDAEAVELEEDVFGLSSSRMRANSAWMRAAEMVSR